MGEYLPIRKSYAVIGEGASWQSVFPSTHPLKSKRGGCRVAEREGKWWKSSGSSPSAGSRHKLRFCMYVSAHDSDRSNYMKQETKHPVPHLPFMTLRRFFGLVFSACGLTAGWTCGLPPISITLPCQCIRSSIPLGSFDVPRVGKQAGGTVQSIVILEGSDRCRWEAQGNTPADWRAGAGGLDGNASGILRLVPLSLLLSLSLSISVYLCSVFPSSGLSYESYNIMEKQPQLMSII